jgi:hypothetical protein
MSPKSYNVTTGDATVISWQNMSGEDCRLVSWIDVDPVSGEKITRELVMTSRDGYWNVLLQSSEHVEAPQSYESFRGDLHRINQG